MNKELLQKVFLMASVILVAVVLAAVGLIMHLRTSLSQGPIGFFSPEDVETLSSIAETVRAEVVNNKACLYPVDKTSLGDKKNEAEMLYVVDRLSLYRITFGLPAPNLEDLGRLVDSEEMRRLRKECFLYGDPGGATVVGCGDAKPSTRELDELASSAAYIERFYKVGNAEVLYVPAHICEPSEFRGQTPIR